MNLKKENICISMLHDYVPSLEPFYPLWRVVNAGNIYDNHKIFFSNYLIMLIMLIIDECSKNLNIRIFSKFSFGTQRKIDS